MNHQIHSLKHSHRERTEPCSGGESLADTPSAALEARRQWKRILNTQKESTWNDKPLTILLLRSEKGRYFSDEEEESLESLLSFKVLYFRKRKDSGREVCELLAGI